VSLVDLSSALYEHPTDPYLSVSHRAVTAMTAERLRRRFQVMYILIFHPVVMRMVTRFGGVPR